MFILIGARIFSLDLLRRERPPVGRASARLAAGRRKSASSSSSTCWCSSSPSSSTSSSWPSSSFRCWRPSPQTLGIDLIWFGVILAVNMQTSFMHPPFGFALFYLRSVAPRTPYTDKVTGRTMPPVTSGQIYWGAVPFVRHSVFDGRAAHRISGAGGTRTPVPCAQTLPGEPLTPARATPLQNRGFSLSPYPPAIPGAPPPITTGRAPTLDLSSRRSSSAASIVPGTAQSNKLKSEPHVAIEPRLSRLSAILPCRCRHRRAVRRCPIVSGVTESPGCNPMGIPRDVG